MRRAGTLLAGAGLGTAVPVALCGFAQPHRTAEKRQEVPDVNTLKIEAGPGLFLVPAATRYSCFAAYIVIGPEMPI